MKILAVTNMYPTPERPAFGTFVESQVDSLRREGIEVDVLFVDGRAHTRNYLWGFPRLWLRLLTNRYDLIHAHYVFSGVIARAQFLCPVVLTHHGVEVLRGWQSILSRLITPLVDGVIVRSQEMKQRLNCSRAVVIPAGVDFDLFKPMSQMECRRSLGLPEDQKLILWAGEHFRAEKRFDIAKEAVDRLRKRILDAELVLVTGKPHSTVPLYMNACDALLLVSDAEGSPNVVKEAMACNMPIVTVAVGDVADVIGDTDGCYMCSQEPEDVVQKLEMALRRGRRTEGRERIRSLDIGLVSRRITELYQRLIEQKKRQSLTRLRLWSRNGRRE